MLFLTNDHVRAVLTTGGSDGIFSYFAGTDQEKEKIPAPVASAWKYDRAKGGTLPDLMARRWPGRTDARQVTLLINSGTQGLQFAAVGSKAHGLAKSRGLGYNLPTEWFVQDIRD